MAAHARQQYFADEESIQKQAREFSLVDELKNKLDSVEWGAQVNVIEEVQENGVPLEIVDKTVNVEVPLVIDNLYTVDPDNSLSAKQGKILYDLIQNLASRGRYLSNWNAATGLPITNPVESPYEYRAGDYYIVSNVAAQGGTNYRPEPNEFIIGQASTIVETEIVKVTDMYLYDGTNWNLLINSTREIAIDSSLSTTSTNPVENRVITNAINTKQDILIAGANIQIASDGKTISATDTTYTAGANIQIDANNQISATDTVYTAGANIQIDANNQISATDTVYTAGDGIAINNNVISNTRNSAEWGNITGTLSDQTDLQNALNAKQDKFHTTSSSSPSNPSEGDEWYDTTNDVLKVYDGSNWIETGRIYTAGDGIAISAQNVISNTRKSVAVSQTAPANPAAGDLWYNTTKDVMFLYDGNIWTIIGPEIYPITKAAYDALSNAEKTDGRFFLITDNDGTIYVDWANVQNKPEIQTEFYTVSSTAPSNPNEGDQWYDTTNDALKVYDGSNWIATGKTYTAGNGLSLNSTEFSIDTTVVATQTDLATKQGKFHTTSSFQPSNPSEGDEWYDSYNDVLKVYDGTQWNEVGVGAGNMVYADFNWEAKTGATVELSLRSEITPSANFTVNTPSTIKDGQYYVLRVTNGANAYTMTLGANVINPYSEDLTLEANTEQQFTFLAKNGLLELQPSAPEGIISSNNTYENIIHLSQADYEALATKDPNTLYSTPDGGDLGYTLTVTLTSAGWSSNEQTVTATGVTSSNTVIVSPAPASMEDYTNGKVLCTAQGTDSLTFTCDTEPSNDITVNVVIIL